MCSLLLLTIVCLSAEDQKKIKFIEIRVMSVRNMLHSRVRDDLISSLESLPSSRAMYEVLSACHTQYTIRVTLAFQHSS